MLYGLSADNDAKARSGGRRAGLALAVDCDLTVLPRTGFAFQADAEIVVQAANLAHSRPRRLARVLRYTSIPGSQNTSGHVMDYMQGTLRVSTPGIVVPCVCSMSFLALAFLLDLLLGEQFHRHAMPPIRARL